MKVKSLLKDSSKEATERLNEALARLMTENAGLRRKIEAAEVIIRRRAPNADGLSFSAAMKTILDDRDAASSRVQFFRDQLKKMLKMLAQGQVKEVMKEINHFLFHNQR